MTTPTRRSRRISLRSGLLVAAIIAVGAGVISDHRAPPNTKPVTVGPTAVNPARFAKTACIAYPPTVGNRHRTVFLDAGHGGLDPGSVGQTRSGKTIYEADETLPVELDAMALLRKQGFRVVVSRTTNSSVARLTPADVDGSLLTAQGVHDDVAARDVCANEAGANALIGIYFDAGATNNAGSVTGYDAARPFAAANLRLATLVQDDVLAAMNSHGWSIPDGGVQVDDQLGSSINEAADAYGHLLLLGPAKRGFFDTPSQMPGTLIEPLFITDPFEGSIANGSEGQHAIASGIASAVEQFFAPPSRNKNKNSNKNKNHT
ncbi:MAG TPA: N-acetylmuramoyl-L-alanine amidase [Solirubrobacteraceae bacterium]|jgi:N-acetylmuramoyl-L-alanine amidase|nr:N-acetylmuramoyl-L-alanine amidase [Solirubrobacteraceae bacterium]